MDTGNDDTPDITQDGTFDLTLTGQEAGASIVYEVSTDAGVTWTATTAAQSGLADGDYVFRAVVTDAADNSAITNEINVTIDNTAPDTGATIDIVAMGDGTFMEGETVTFTADFGEAVTVTGSPTHLTLSNGEVAVLDMGASDLSIGSLVFTYAVNAADANTTSLQVTGLNGTGVIEDLAGNLAAVMATTDLTIIIDTMNPDDLSVQGVDNATIGEFTEPGTVAFASGTGTMLALFAGADSGAAPELMYTFGASGDFGGAVELYVNLDGDTELRVLNADFFDFEDNPLTEIDIVITDAAGNVTNDVFTVNLTDLDDAPEITPGGDIMATIMERPDVTMLGDTTENDPTDFGYSGSIGFTDDDITDEHSVSVTNISSMSNVAALNGDFIGVFLAGQADPANGDGIGRIDWTFGNVTPGGQPNTGTPLTAGEMAIVDSLGVGEYIEQVFRITITQTDLTSPLTTFQDVTIRIEGTNDAPVIEVDTGAGDTAAAAIDETDAALTAMGTLSVSDVDTTDIVDVDSTSTAVMVDAMSSTFAGTNPLSMADLQGMFSADVAGLIGNGDNEAQVTWNFDSSSVGATAFDFLAMGETLVLIYTVTATDDSDTGNATDLQTVTITITGTNDDPSIDVIAQTDLTETTDTMAIATTINATFVDVDLNDIGHTASVIAASGAGVDNGQVEADLLAFIGTITADKLVDSNTGTIAVAFSAASTDFDYLALGEVYAITYTLELDDGDGGVVTRDFVVEITGTNDLPSVADASGAATEDAGVANIAFGAITDVDLSNTHTYQITSAPSEGSVTLGMDGISFDFDPGADFQDLAMGETRDVTFTYTVTDNDGGVSTAATATVTVTGANDTPTVTVTDVDETIAEGDAALSTMGSFDIEDVDLTDVVTVSAISVATSGNDSGVPADLSALFTAELNDTIIDGSNTTGTVDWTFDTSAGDFDYLAVGESVILTYTVSVSDDNVPPATVTQAIVVTITGTNDAPTVTDMTDVDHDFDEGDAALSTLGAFDIEDLDVTDIVTVSAISAVATGTTSGAPASLESLFTAELTDTIIDGMNTAGTVDWTFDAAAGDFDYLAHDESIVITYTVTISDDETGSVTQNVVITINGTNDRPEIASGATLALNEQTGMVGSANLLSGSGSLVLSDLDVTDTHSITDVLTSVVWAESAGGATIIDPLPTSLMDALAVDTGAFSANNILSNNSIDWFFDLADSEVDFLAAGETLTVTYTITATDTAGFAVASGDDEESESASRTVVITLTGTNDVPTLEAETIEIDDGVGIDDFAYDGANSSANTSEVDISSVTVGTGATAVTTVTISGQLDGADVDLSDTLTYAIDDGSGGTTQFMVLTSGGVTGLLTVDAATGAYTFVYDAALVNALDETQSETLTATILISDGTVTTPAAFSLNFDGENDLPVIVTEPADFNLAVEEYADNSVVPGFVENVDNHVRTLTIEFTDAEITDNHTATITPVELTSGPNITAPTGQFIGVFSTGFDNVANGGNIGEVTFQFTVNDSVLDSLSESQTLTQAYRVLITDTTDPTSTVFRDIIVTIEGTNDEAVIDMVASDFTGMGITETAMTTGDTVTMLSDTGTIFFADVDLDNLPAADGIADAHTLSVAHVSTTHSGALTGLGEIGAVTFSAITDDALTGDGSQHEFDWIYNVADADVDFLAAGETIDVVFAISINDGSGAANAIVTQNITGYHHR